jgi:hypothetical protein
MENVNMNKEEQEWNYLLFRNVFAFVRDDLLISLDPVPKSISDFGLINGCQIPVPLEKAPDRHRPGNQRVSPFGVTTSNSRRLPGQGNKANALRACIVI